MIKSHMSGLLWLLVTTSVRISDALWGALVSFRKRSNASELEEEGSDMLNNSAPKTHIPVNLSDFISKNTYCFILSKCDFLVNHFLELH